MSDSEPLESARVEPNGVSSVGGIFSRALLSLPQRCLVGILSFAMRTNPCEHTKPVQADGLNPGPVSGPPGPQESPPGPQEGPPGPQAELAPWNDRDL